MFACPFHASVRIKMFRLFFLISYGPFLFPYYKREYIWDRHVCYPMHSIWIYLYVFDCRTYYYVLCQWLMTGRWHRIKQTDNDITVILSILISKLESNKSKQSYYAARNEVNNKTYHTIVTVQKFNRQIVERGKIDSPNKQFHNRSLSWLGTLVGLY